MENSHILETVSCITGKVIKENFESIGNVLGTDFTFRNPVDTYRTDFAEYKGGYLWITLLNSLELVGRYDHLKKHVLLTRSNLNCRTLFVYLLTMCYSRFSSRYTNEERNTLINRLVSTYESNPETFLTKKEFDLYKYCIKIKTDEDIFKTLEEIVVEGGIDE